MKTDITSIDIKLWGELMGKLAINPVDGIGYFRYSDEFIKKGIEPSPINMPVKKGVTYSFPKLGKETFKGLPGLISDSLPDAFGDSLLELYFRKKGVTDNASIELLKLCYISNKAIGALEFLPALKNAKNESIDLDLSDIVGLIDKLVSSKQKLSEGDLNDIQDIISVASSLGGAAPKAVIGIDFTTNKILKGNIVLPPNFDYWIIKFDALKRENAISFSQPKGFCNVEYVYYLMAKEAGINMFPCKLLKDDNRYHFLTKRFDRVDNEKIHMQSLHALAHMDSYSNSWDYDHYFRVLTYLKLDYKDHEEIYRRLVFNGLSGNTDTHTKNTSFLMDKNGIWSLSPCYDVICSVGINNKSSENHKTTINGKRKGITKTDYLEVAKRTGIKHAEKIFEQVKLAIDKWDDLSKLHDVKPEYQNHVKSVIDANMTFLNKTLQK